MSAAIAKSARASRAGARRTRAQTASSSGRSTWQETTAYRSRDVAPIAPKLYERSTAPLLVVVAAAALPRLAGPRARARDDPRGVRREERPVRTRRSSTSGTFGFLPGRPVRVHAAALRLVPRGALLAVRPLVARRRARADRWSPSRRRCVVFEIGTRLALAAGRPRRRARGDAAPVRRLARRPPQPRDRSTACSLAAARRCCALVAYERRSLRLAAATGAVAGLAILGNARLVLLPARARASTSRGARPA